MKGKDHGVLVGSDKIIDQVSAFISLISASAEYKDDVKVELGKKLQVQFLTLLNSFITISISVLTRSGGWACG